MQDVPLYEETHLQTNFYEPSQHGTIMNNQVNLELEVEDSEKEQQMTMMMEAGGNTNQVEGGDLDIFEIFET